MIVGTGMVAKAFDKISHSDLLIFASGVSNSQSTNVSEYLREQELLTSVLSKNPNLTLVYFSTYSVYDPSLNESFYIKHKLETEKNILHSANRAIIVRTSNLVGKTNNPYTLTNFIANHIKNKEVFNVWKGAKRNLLDVDDLVKMTASLNQSGFTGIVNLVNPQSISMPDLVKLFENIMGRSALINEVDKISDFPFDIEISSELFNRLGLDAETYNEKVILKYYSEY